jgi:23S rRNA pseudouridine1911/1915/1917 synthase
MICAKNAAALSHLQKQFSLRKVKKEYVAIVNGHLDPAEAIIDMPIERHPKKPQTFRTGSAGKPAQTHYQVLEQFGNYDKVALAPETGRTHQIRVHLSHIGHPIVGDSLYGTQEAERLFLHARSLEITLPDKSRVTFTSEEPGAFKEFAKAHAN